MDYSWPTNDSIAPGSSKGRTPGFGPGNRSSNLCPGTKKPRVDSWFFVINTLVQLYLNHENKNRQKGTLGSVAIHRSDSHIPSYNRKTYSPLLHGNILRHTHIFSLYRPCLSCNTNYGDLILISSLTILSYTITTMKDAKEDHIVFNYSQIDENIWVGSNQCCQIHFDNELIKEGVTSDISLEKERVDAPFGVESYLWLPTADHTAPSQEQLGLGSWHIKNLVDTGRKVYIHCQNGHGRAPTLTAAYYIREGMEVDDAIAKIKAKRPEIHIEDVQRAALETFKASL